MAILLNNNGYENAPWAEAFAELLPDMPVYIYPDIPDKHAIRYAVIWHHPHGDLQHYPNLQAILNLGAGTDHLDNDTELPNVPIVRLVDPDVGNDMAQYVLYWAMHFHRGYEQYRMQTSHAVWQRQEVARTIEYRVTVLGLGLIGTEIAQRVAMNGFDTKAWSRSQHDVEDLATYSGANGLAEVLANTDVLVNCLPLNEQTRGLLDNDIFTQLPKGSYFINVSRGAIVNDDDLIANLGSGQLAGAALDTFNQEPLPEDSAFWQLENVYVTPHISGPTFAKSAARPIADNILRIENGEPPFPIHTPPSTKAES